MISKKYFRVKKNGEPYKGSFCKHPELIENYDKAISDNTQIGECHHRLETHTSSGEKRLIGITEEELTALGMYFDRPPEELIFMRTKDHCRLHMTGKPAWNKGKKIGPHSEDSNRRRSITMKGMKRSEEHKRKVSEARKGKPSPVKGKHWKLVEGKRCYY